MKPVVIDNFLEIQSFKNLQNVMFEENFCWSYNEGIDYSDEEGDKFQFFHAFFKEDIFIKAFLFSLPDKTRIALLLKVEIVFNPTVNPNFGTSFKLLNCENVFILSLLVLIGSCVICVF